MWEWNFEVRFGMVKLFFQKAFDLLCRVKFDSVFYSAFFLAFEMEKMLRELI